MIEETNYELLAKYFGEEASPSEIKDVLKWKEKNRSDFDKMQVLWEARNSSSFDSQNAISKVWEKIEEKDVLRPSRYLWMRNVAAAILLFCIIGVGWKTYSKTNSPKHANFATVGNPDLLPKLVTLPDGSMVTLNQDASLSYPEQFSAESRIVQLEGEAFFNVTHNPKQPFIVDLSSSKVTVLGTSFNIFTSPVTTEVLVRTGKVQFATDKEQIILETFERGVYNSSTEVISKESKMPLDDMAWMSRRMVYKDAPFSEVILDIEEIYGLTIQLEDLRIKNCTYTGRLSNVGIKEIFELIKYALNVEIENEGINYLIKGGGCN